MFGFKPKRINTNLLAWSFLVASSFTIVIILEVWNLEVNDTTEHSALEILIQDIYSVIGFPFYWLYEFLLSKNIIPSSVLLYFLSFLLNNLFFSFLLERCVGVYLSIFSARRSNT